MARIALLLQRGGGEGNRYPVWVTQYVWDSDYITSPLGFYFILKKTHYPHAPPIGGYDEPLWFLGEFKGRES